ncbi:MAG: hypothetical protein R2911_08030 [Caldilineaceae bacterium]
MENSAFDLNRVIVPYIQYTLTMWAWWIGHFGLIYGLSLLVGRIFRIQSNNTSISRFQQFWLGIVALFYILQVTHLLWRIDGWTLLIITGAALIGYAAHISTLKFHIPQLTTARLLGSFVIIFIALWTANRGAGPVANSDTALYHLASMEWNAAFPIVKGLGNLHDRFAFNSSYFLYAALTDVGPWQGKSQHFLNSFLLTVLLIQVASYAANILSTRRKIALESVYAMLLVGPLITETLKGSVPSLSPDFPIFLLGIILSCQLLGYLTSPQLSAQQEKFQLYLIVALSCLGITIKLSFLPLGLVSSLLSIIYSYRRYYRREVKSFLSLLWPLGVFCTSYLGIWIARGIILSGYPVYPMTIGALPVPWRIPRSLTISVDMWIRSWARQPWQPWPDVLQNWQWLYPWLHEMPTDIVKLTYVSVAAALLYTAVALWRRRLHLWPFFTLPLAGISFWFLSAPSFRFAGASFWILAAGLLAISLYYLFENRPDSLRINTLLVAISVCLYITPWQQPLLIYPPSTQILPTIPTPATITVQTHSGLSLQTPLPGAYACWRIMLCTPYFRPTLHTFDPLDISQGFYLDQTFTYADINQSSFPAGITAPPNLGVAIVEQLLPIPPASDLPPQLRLLVYSEKPATVHALLNIATDANALIADNRQIVLYANQQTYEFPLSTGGPTKINIPLHKDFNVVILALRNGAIILAPQNQTGVNPTISNNSSLILHLRQIDFFW